LAAGLSNVRLALVPDAVESSVESLRILIVDMPAMLREIVRDAVDGAADMEVIAEVGGEEPITTTICDASADVVLMDAAHPELSEDSHLARSTARLRLLAVEASGREAFLYTLQPVRTPLGELSPDRLLDAIRGTTSNDPDPDG
jgi:DNA-binding NarL/FixJ family response regulator